VGLVYHQGENVLNSYTWTYSDDGGLSQFSGSENGTVPFASANWHPTGGLMPIHDVSGVTAALMSGGLANFDLITSCTSNDGTASYSYDAMGQLTGANYSGEEAQDGESYSYDANGNRIMANDASYTTGADNRLISDGKYNYSYDAEGNRIARFIDSNHDDVLDTGDIDITEYHWDNRNRLTEVLNRDSYGGAATKVVDYIYDVENRWIGESIDSNGDGTIDRQIRFAYDGNQIVLEFERDDAGAVTGADLSHRYLWQPDAVDQLMADEWTHLDNGNVATDELLWALTDQQGTVHDLAKRDTTTGATAVVDHIMYNIFGKVVSESDTSQGSLIKYTGRATDNFTGIEFHDQRVKIAGSANWMKPDPIGFYGRQTNLYVYCGNSPTNATDPTGCRTPGAKQILDFFATLKRMKLSDNEIVAMLITRALSLTGGNAKEAFALIYEIRHIPGADNDIWASLDHFFQSWTLRNIVPTGLYAGVGAGFANDWYSFKKLVGLSVQRDNPNTPPSPVTLLQYRWGNIGAWAAFWYDTDLILGSPEWKDFMRWLDSQM
jgi:RHS repeat-associated protein